MFTHKPRPLLVSIITSLGLACEGAAPSVSSTTETTGPWPATDPPMTATDLPTSSSTDGEYPTSTTNMSATGAESGMSSTGTDTTAGASGCGDGIVDADEQCDEGISHNDDSRFCTSTCKLNICGDGKLFIDWELCDKGPANSDTYGSLCGKQCVPGPRCGDNKLQPEYETCDLGPDNNSMTGDEQGILCDASCRALQLRGFITKDAFNGDLGGLFGADQKCRAAATAAGLSEPERFHAFLSTGDLDAKQRFEGVAPTFPYVLVTGKKVANSFAALIETGPVDGGISVTENGATIYEATVATNTQPGGIRYNNTDHCQSWTSADGAHAARSGHSGLPADAPEVEAWKTELWWTGFLSWPCKTASLHIYCLEI